MLAATNEKSRVDSSRDIMTCFSTRTMVPQSEMSDSAELHGQGRSQRTGGNTVHSKSYSTHYVR